MNWTLAGLVVAAGLAVALPGTGQIPTMWWGLPATGSAGAPLAGGAEGSEELRPPSAEAPTAERRRPGRRPAEAVLPPAAALGEGALRSGAGGDPAADLLAHLDGSARRLVAETLERNPGLARARFQASAAAQRPPQAATLPDPRAEVSLFALPPETRVGPQRLSVSLWQRLPARGRRSLESSVLEFEAATADARVAAARLELVTETRRRAYELAFLALRRAILVHEKEHLESHELLARARYAAGAGLQQGVLKIQAAITRSEQKLLQVEMMHRAQLAALNRLRDRPASSSAEIVELPEPRALTLDGVALRQVAAAKRPELRAVGASLRAAQHQVRLAGKESSPNFDIGLAYTLVDRRRDVLGRATPPQGNGNDILSLSASVNLPVWNRRLSAALEEALAAESAARELERSTRTQIEAQLGELEARLPLLYEQWFLFEHVLRQQAEEALRSAESAYATGHLNALDLLEAEHMLFDVQNGAIRTRADWAIAWGELEGAVGGSVPLEEVQNGQG